MTSIALANVFCFALCLIFFALCAYCSVDMVSVWGWMVVQQIVSECMPRAKGATHVMEDEEIVAVLECEERLTTNGRK